MGAQGGTSRSGAGVVHNPVAVPNPRQRAWPGRIVREPVPLTEGGASGALLRSRQHSRGPRAPRLGHGSRFARPGRRGGPARSLPRLGRAGASAGSRLSAVRPDRAACPGAADR
ncbi:hypothetical protein SFR_2698 [Streptomyces sp. FR-008]|nr:hypothetical protein SFR_2698 [Streptomyces sp. FR-008]